MSSAIRMKALLVSPLVIYPIVVILMVCFGWWRSDMRLAIVSVLGALIFLAKQYPIAVFALFLVHYFFGKQPTWIRMSAAIAVAVALNYGLDLYWGMLDFSDAFSASVLFIPTVAWAILFEASSRKLSEKSG